MNSSRIHMLPKVPYRLIGREHEVAYLQQLICQSHGRLVTITGPGGVGKTSLALQVAALVSPNFADGAAFVLLAAITDPISLIPAILQTLHLPESSDQPPLDQLKAELRERFMLLLLDNFEQILIAAPVLVELLAFCDNLHILVTSRETLRVRGEHTLPLAPLPCVEYPVTGEVFSLAQLIQNPSIALFLDRACAIQPEFQLTAENAQAVAEICTRLDGLPLAIELAAVRIGTLSPLEIAKRMAESALGFLTVGARDLPQRQQTLRSAIQWSYSLLTAQECRAFRWLAIFFGMFSLEAAEALLDRGEALALLESLVAKSLIRTTATVAHQQYFSMLETVREYGLQELTQTEERQTAQQIHTNYYLVFAEEAASGMLTYRQQHWLDQIAHAQDNLRTVLQRAIDSQDGQTAQRMAGALWRFWFTRGHWNEGRRWLTEALAIQTGEPVESSIHAYALYAAGTLARYQGDLGSTQALCEQSAALYRAQSNHAGLLNVLVQFCFVQHFFRNEEALNRLSAEVIALLTMLPDSAEKGYAIAEFVVAQQQQIERERQSTAIVHLLAESERIQRTIGSPGGLAFTLLWQGVLALAGNDWPAAQRYLDEGERLAEQVDDVRTLSRISLNQLTLDLLGHNTVAARQRIERLLRRAYSRSDYHIMYLLCAYAGVLSIQGLPTWAARVFGMADSRASTTAMQASLATFEQRHRITEARRAVHEMLGDDSYQHESDYGRRMSIDEVLNIPQSSASDTHSSSNTAPSSPIEPLTARELDVLHLLAQELNNPQIADRLVVSRRTVDAHLRSIYGKLGVKSRESAIRAAQAFGLLSRRYLD